MWSTVVRKREKRIMFEWSCPPAPASQCNHICLVVNAWGCRVGTSDSSWLLLLFLNACKSILDLLGKFVVNWAFSSSCGRGTTARQSFCTYLIVNLAIRKFPQYRNYGFCLYELVHKHMVAALKVMMAPSLWQLVGMKLLVVYHVAVLMQPSLDFLVLCKKAGFVHGSCFTWVVCCELGIFAWWRAYVPGVCMHWPLATADAKKPISLTTVNMVAKENAWKEKWLWLIFLLSGQYIVEWGKRLIC